MKTTIFSLTTILVFYTFLFAANASIVKEGITFTKIEIRIGFAKEIAPQLVPATPSEATFEDADKTGTPEISSDHIKDLAPVTPKEASFEDVFSGYSQETYLLSPLTPKEATFED